MKSVVISAIAFIGASALGENIYCPSADNHLGTFKLNLLTVFDVNGNTYEYLPLWKQEIPKAFNSLTTVSGSPVRVAVASYSDKGWGVFGDESDTCYELNAKLGTMGKAIQAVEGLAPRYGGDEAMSLMDVLLRYPLNALPKDQSAEEEENIIVVVTNTHFKTMDELDPKNELALPAATVEGDCRLQHYPTYGQVAEVLQSTNTKLLVLATPNVFTWYYLRMGKFGVNASLYPLNGDFSNIRSSFEAGVLDHMCHNLLAEDDGPVVPNPWPANWAQKEEELVDLINEFRATEAKESCYQLRIEPLASDAARRHSFDMTQAEIFSHYGSDGQDPGTRALLAEYEGEGHMGEILARGSPLDKPAEVLEAWKRNRIHRENLLGCGWTDAGIGYSFDEESNTSYWTVTLSRHPEVTTTTADPLTLFARENQFIFLLNDFREVNGCGELEKDSNLRAVANSHAADMALKEYYDHYSSQGTSSKKRAAMSGAPYFRYELVDYDAETSDHVLEHLAEKEDSRKVLLDCSLTHVGVGQSMSLRWGRVWSVDFGKK